MRDRNEVYEALKMLVDNGGIRGRSTNKKKQSQQRIVDVMWTLSWVMEYPMSHPCTERGKGTWDWDQRFTDFAQELLDGVKDY